MRLSKVVPLDEQRSVTVTELRVKDVRNLVAQYKALDGLKIADLLGGRFDELVALLPGCLAFPEGESLNDLSGSEMMMVAGALLEVNAAFLSLLPQEARAAMAVAENPAAASAS